MTRTISPTRKCSACGRTGLQNAIVPYRTELRHDGRAYPIAVNDLPAIQCPHCQSLSLTDDSLKRLDEALREAVRLMPAERILAERRALRLKKREFAIALRMAPATITRFERASRVQSAPFDLLMQLYLASGHVRTLVSSFHAGRDLFETARVLENGPQWAVNSWAIGGTVQAGVWSGSLFNLKVGTDMRLAPEGPRGTQSTIDAGLDQSLGPEKVAEQVELEQPLARSGAPPPFTPIRASTSPSHH